MSFRFLAVATPNLSTTSSVSMPSRITANSSDSMSLGYAERERIQFSCHVNHRAGFGDPRLAGPWMLR